MRLPSEVSAKLKKILADQEAGMLADTGGLTVSAYLDKWLDHMARDRAPSTVSGYRRTAENYVKPGLGRRKLEALRPLDLHDLYTSLPTLGASVWMVRYVHTVMHRALEQAVLWQMLPRNVADAARPPKAKRRREISCWAPADVVRFLETATGHRLRPLFYLALMTGMRKGELLGLHWNEVDLERGTVSVHYNLSEVNGELFIREEPKTKASRRTITIPADTVEVLREHRRRQAAERLAVPEVWTEMDLVFPSEVGTPLFPANVFRAYKALIRRTGLDALATRGIEGKAGDEDFEKLVEEASVRDIRFHDLRHTHASILILKGGNAKAVSDRLGHTSVTFTLDTYGHLFDEQRRELAFSFSDMFEERTAA